MKLLQQWQAAALLLWVSQGEAQAHGHGAHQRAHAVRRLNHSHNHNLAENQILGRSSIVRRNSQGKALCSLPSHPDLVKVPGAKNSGFAMSPDQECVEGSYCPIACKSGKVMAQWEPGSSFTYPSSMVCCSWGVFFFSPCVFRLLPPLAVE